MSSLFDCSGIKRITKDGYVGKEFYDIFLWNFSVIRVTDKYAMQELETTIKEVKKMCERTGLEDCYYQILTEELKEKGW